MFHRPAKRMNTENTNSAFAKYLQNVTEHPGDFPQFIDAKGYIVLPRVAREFGLAVNNATNSIDINNEHFYEGNFSNLAIRDDVSQLVCTFTGCRFESSQFKRSQFANVNMAACIFYEADFSNSDVRNANINFLVFYKVIFDDADCSNAVLSSDSNNSHPDIDSCSFQRTNLRNVRMVTGDSGYYAHSTHYIGNSIFDGDLPNVTIAGYDFKVNKFSNSKVSNFSLSNSKSSLNPFGSYLFHNIFKNVTFQDSSFLRAMFSENTFDGVAFDRVNLRETIWDLGDYEKNLFGDDSVVNVFQNTSMRDVDASNAMLIDAAVTAYHQPADLNAISGIDYCTVDVIDYFKNNNVTISGNSLFTGRNNTFDCASLGIRIATIGVPLTIIAVIACAAFISRYLGKTCLDRNTIAMNMRLFSFRRDEEQRTPLLPLGSNGARM